jgi:TolB-like protein
MKTIRSFVRPVCLALGLVLALSLAGSSAFAQPDTKIAAKLAEALDHRIYGRFDEGLAITSALLQRDDLTSKDSIAIFEVMSIIYFSKGEEFYKKSYDYLDKISSIGPCVIELPHDIWPKGLRRHWYSLVSAKDALTCHGKDSPDIQNIAVMPFDNFSVGEYQEQLGALGAGLADFFQYDFSKISSLTVIERDKIDYLIEEQNMVKEGKIDEATAIQAGKILGAHLMVFGSFTQIDSRQTRVVVRAVNVETSEIVASVSAEGRPDYFNLEKKLVEDLANELNIKLTNEDKQLIDEGGTESFDATTLYAQGLEFEDKYDYQKAYEYFKQAYDADPNFEEARRKMDIYRPLATG